MSRAERACRSLPSWALRKILESPLAKSWWTAAYLEIWKREVADEILMATDDESGPWATYLPPGVH